MKNDKEKIEAGYQMQKREIGNDATKKVENKKEEEKLKTEEKKKNP